MVMFWANICQNTEETKVTNLIYKLMYNLNEESVYKSPQLNCV